MSVQVEPYQLRFLASRFSQGSQELLSRANRLESIMNQIVQGSWKGEGAHAFAIRCEMMKGEIQKAVEVLDNAIQTLNRFANQMDRVNQLRQQANMLEQQSWQYSGDSIDELHHRQNLARQAAQIRQEAEWEANAADAQAANEFNSIMSMIPQLMEQVSQYRGSNSNSGELDELPEPLRSYYLRHRDLLQDDKGETAATLTMGSFKEMDYEGVVSLENRHEALVKKAREILRIKNVEGYITDPNEIEQIVDQSFQMECGDLSDDDLETFIQRNSESMQLAERMQNDMHNGIDITGDPEYFAFARMMGGYEPTGFNPDGVVSMVRGRLFGNVKVDTLPSEYENLKDGYYSDSEDVNNIENEQENNEADSRTFPVENPKFLKNTLDDLKLKVMNGESSDSLANKVIEEIGQSIKSNPLRQEYEGEVAGLQNKVEVWRIEGLSDKEISQRMSEERRQLGVKYKDATPSLLREYIYEVNSARYGDKLGPTFKYLEKKYDYDYEAITEAATRPNPNVDKLLGGFKAWLLKNLKS